MILRVIDSKAVAGSAKQNAVNLFIIGFTSTSVQLLMMREILNISGGYELMTGYFSCILAYRVSSRILCFKELRTEMSSKSLI